MKKSLLNAYARLIVEKGINIQKGQEVTIVCELDQPVFVEILVKLFYQRGAKKVVVDFRHQPLLKLDLKYQKLETLSYLEKWEIERYAHRAEALPAYLYLVSENPDGLCGVNLDKLTKSTAAKYPIIKPFRDKMESRYQWCIAAVAGKKWAKKIFPSLSSKAAVEKLWETILSCSRAIGNPIENWNEHNKTIKQKCDILNNLNLAELIYTASNGTNLKVGLLDNGVFLGGSETTLSGIEFNPNIPSEEIYTTPNRAKADGIVYSSKPLNFNGQLIENFYLQFENGKVTKFGAEKNVELLKEMLNMDEGSKSLGECALVPFKSPINNTNILFYETLFDENACCHFAVGRGFNEALRGYENMTADEIRSQGVNESSVHTDFMIGTADLKIQGITKKGDLVTIFENGNWAI